MIAIGETIEHGVKEIKVKPGTNQEAISTSAPSVVTNGIITNPSTGVADWVKPEHQIPFLLAISLYTTPSVGVGEYFILPEYTQTRSAVWKTQDGKYFIGCRGTTVGLNDSFIKDLTDDAIIAGLNEFGTLDTSLALEAEKSLLDLVDQGINASTQIMLGGHSLGGNAALNLAAKYQCRACSFNGGGTVVSTNYIGPGPTLATHYHIAGDWISTHVALYAAEIIRVDKHATFDPTNSQGAFWAHKTDRFYKVDPSYGFLSPQQEQDAIYSFAWNLMWNWWRLLPWISALQTSSAFYIFLQITRNPIPGSNFSIVSSIFPGAKDQKQKEFGKTVLNLYKNPQ